MMHDEFGENFEIGLRIVFGPECHSSMKRVFGYEGVNCSGYRQVNASYDARVGHLNHAYARVLEEKVEAVANDCVVKKLGEQVTIGDHIPNSDEMTLLSSSILFISGTCRRAVGKSR